MMKTRLSRLLSIFIVLLLLVSVVACSNDKEPEPTVEPTPTETAEPKETEKPKEEETPAPTEDVDPIVEYEGGLKDVYEDHGLIAGTCLAPAMIGSEKYTSIILENFNTITLENHMKPEAILDHKASIEAGEIVVKFPKDTIDLLDFAKENNLSVRGHTIVWHSQTPDWIFFEDFDTTKGEVDRDTMLDRMEKYIKRTFEILKELDYIDMFYAYDVVNEALLDNGSLRDSHWKSTIGDDYIWYAFYYADKYAPDHIKLYYNDFNEQFKTQAYIKLAKSLVDDDGEFLIDGLGCQGHLYTKDSIDSYISMLKSFAELGLDVQITELDISLGTWQQILKATDDNLKDQGKYYYELISRIIAENEAGNTNVSGITFWGFADQLSWRRDRSPLLFDAKLNPKYSYHGAMLNKDHAGY